MILKRKLYSALLAWKEECRGSKALLIEGARRVGKSTLCEEFGKNEYQTCLVIDFAKQEKEVEEYFRLYLNDLDTFFSRSSETAPTRGRSRSPTRARWTGTATSGSRAS